jgi:soluble lytic murein transglycosylase-like protein
VRLFLCVCAALALGGCSAASLSRLTSSTPRPPAHASLAAQPATAAPRVAATQLDGLIAEYAAINNVPPALIHRVIQRECGYNPRARNGPYWGLMQIRHDTAMSMGYRGPASGLLDAETNLRYGVRYLAGAYLVANRNSDQAVRNYARGYYYDAKRMGLLEETGLR